MAKNTSLMCGAERRVRSSNIKNQETTMQSKFLLKVCLVWCIAGPALAQSHAFVPAPGTGITDRLIVKYRNEAAPSDAPTNTPTNMQPLSNAKKSILQRKLSEATFTIAKESAMPFGARVVSLGRPAREAEVNQVAKNLMASDPDIEYAVADRIIYLAQAALPTPQAQAVQWPLFDSLSGIRALPAWQLLSSLPQRRPSDPNLPIVAIIDSGYRPHVDIAPPFLGKDYVDGSDSPLDPGDSRAAGQCQNLPVPQASTWHGLGVEGIIAARTNNSVGLSGVAGTGTAVLHQRVFGPCGGYLSTYLAAIHDAVDFRSPAGQRVRVINLSQAGPAPCDTPLQTEISRAINAGVTVVTSAGNSAQDVSTSSPANCKGTISVAATDRFGNRAPYSNYGAGVTLSAPGGDSYSRTFNDGVLTTALNLAGTEPTGQQSSDYNYVQGTSFSAPHVSAAAALLFSLNPQLTVDQVKTILVRTAKPVPGICTGGCGAGMLDLRKALELAQSQKASAQLCALWGNSMPWCTKSN
jgi:serine protease